MPTRLKTPAAVRLAISLLGLAACGTQEIDPNNVVISSAMPAPDKGGLTVIFPSTDATYQAEEARAAAGGNSIQYHLLLDGHLLVSDSGGGNLTPFTVGEGGAASIGYLEAGTHHFAIAASGSAPIFEVNGQITGAATTTLFLYGALNALQGRFATLRDAVTAGAEHDVVVNLMRSGQSIEVVSCTDGTCTPVSPALALGDVFDAEFPSPDAAGSTYSLNSLTDTGTGIGYRLVPSTTAPAPPVLPLYLAFTLGVSTVPQAPNFVGAPVFISDQGDPQILF